MKFPTRLLACAIFFAGVSLLLASCADSDSSSQDKPHKHSHRQKQQDSSGQSAAPGTTDPLASSRY